MSFRAIDVGRERPVVPADQAAPMLDWVAVEKLVIDDRYQRPLGPVNWKSIRRIAEAFEWAKFTPVLVSPVEGGRFAVIDGQHRVHAAAICGFTVVPAMAVHLSVAQQAGSFAAVNGNVTKITGYQVFKAALAANEPWAERCDRVVTDAGCRLMTCKASAADRKAGQVYQIGLIRELVLAGHSGAVGAGLAALRAHDRSGDARLWVDGVIRPWLTALAMVPEHRGRDLAGFLDAQGMFRMLATVERARLSPELAATAAPTARRALIAQLVRSHFKAAAKASAVAA